MDDDKIKDKKTFGEKTNVKSIDAVKKVKYKNLFSVFIFGNSFKRRKFNK